MERHNGVWSGWCQFGPTDELPRTKHAKAHREGLGALPDRRITCFFVDRTARRAGVASTALGGALEEIARTRRIGKHRWVVAKTVADG